MKLPLLLSVPHAGLNVPPEVTDDCLLTRQQIVEDSDKGAASIYWPLQSKVSGFISTDVARAIVDLNRAETDRRRDGVIKTHTCWDVPVYCRFPSETTIETLLERYYRPYHRCLASLAEQRSILGIDCHTMAAVGPPIGPMAGETRPALCLSNASGTCSQKWFLDLAKCLEDAFGQTVSLNHPFTGGYIIRSHSEEMPWVQLELSRAPFMPESAKGEAVLRAFTAWCDRMGFA